MNDKRYKTILADPPWPEVGGTPKCESWGGSKRGADQHYPVMRVDEIAAIPVYRWARRDAHLWLWTTDQFLHDALHVLGRWGFRYVRTMIWHKKKGGKTQIGLGQYLRGAHEICLFGVRGSLPYARDDQGKRITIPSVFEAGTTAHSAKPERSYEIIEKVSPGPRLELFAREARPGWDAMGEEIDGTVFGRQGGLL